MLLISRPLCHPSEIPGGISPSESAPRQLSKTIEKDKATLLTGISTPVTKYSVVWQTIVVIAHVFRLLVFYMRFYTSSTFKPPIPCHINLLIIISTDPHPHTDKFNVLPMYATLSPMSPECPASYTKSLLQKLYILPKFSNVSSLQNYSINYTTPWKVTV